jgi:hypothetical protein
MCKDCLNNRSIMQMSLHLGKECPCTCEKKSIIMKGLLHNMPFCTECNHTVIHKYT